MSESASYKNRGHTRPSSIICLVRREMTRSLLFLADDPGCFGAQFIKEPTIAASSERFRSGVQSSRTRGMPTYSVSKMLETSIRSKARDGGAISARDPSRKPCASLRASVQNTWKETLKRERRSAKARSCSCKKK
jgi:hypothetical protein